MIEQELAARLLGSATLAALVGDRIEPVINSQDTALPALSYQRISAISEYSHDGQAGVTARIQLTALAGSYAQVCAVLAACREVLDGVRWANDWVSFVESEMDGYNAESRQAGVYVRRMDVMVVDP